LRSSNYSFSFYKLFNNSLCFYKSYKVWRKQSFINSRFYQQVKTDDSSSIFKNDFTWLFISSGFRILFRKNIDKFNIFCESSNRFYFIDLINPYDKLWEKIVRCGRRRSTKRYIIFMTSELFSCFWQNWSRYGVSWCKMRIGSY
jgi:hypothetical protein